MIPKYIRYEPLHISDYENNTMNGYGVSQRGSGVLVGSFSNKGWPFDASERIKHNCDIEFKTAWFSNDRSVKRGHHDVPERDERMI